MAKSKEKEDCFIIMPIGDGDSHDNGHFRRVFEDIISPACEVAGYCPQLASDVKETNLIHLDILKKLIDAPIAICDLSTRNPNVLFELGIRQAFDKPVVLIQESGTEKIFDISPMRYLEYSKELKYHDVLATQRKLTEAIQATVNAEGEAGNINSIVQLLGLDNPATIPNIETGNREILELGVLHSEMRELRMMLETTLMNGNSKRPRDSLLAVEYERITKELTRLEVSKRRMPTELKHEVMMNLSRDAETLMEVAREEGEHRVLVGLMKRIDRMRRDYM